MQSIGAAALMMLSVLAGCSSGGDDCKAIGFSVEQKECISMNTSVCTWCGDYACVLDGSTYTAGTKMRICGIGPRWNGSCPSTTTLGDGSDWQFQANCSCD